MKITGTVIDRTPNLKIDMLKEALAQELRNRRADVKINYKGEIEWTAHKLILLIISFFNRKVQRLFGTKGLICFNMNIYRGWTISFESSVFSRWLLMLIIEAVWLYWIISLRIPTSTTIIFVSIIIASFIIDYITLKFWFIRLIKKQIKKVIEATENASKIEEKQD
jgi:hypothetical protein